MQKEFPKAQRTRCPCAGLNLYQSWQGYDCNVMPSLVKAYRLLYLDGAGDWREIARADGNYQRHRTHQVEMPKTRAIRLEILGTNGLDRSQVYSIRAY